MARAFTVRIGGVALGGVLALGVVGGVLAAEEPVPIESFAFDPADLTVSVGDTVTWSNHDPLAHAAMTGRVVVQTASGDRSGNGGATTPPTDTAGSPDPTLPATPIDLFTALLVAAGLGGLWLSGVFARDRIRRD